MKVVRQKQLRGGYSLIEALVYISLVMVVLGCASMSMYRGLDHLFAIKRSADDIAAALKVGELWRADIRSATGGVQLVNAEEGGLLRIRNTSGEVTYRAADEVLWRERNGARSALLRNVRSSRVIEERRDGVLAWRLELELKPQTRGSVKAGRVRPLFTFLAVAPGREVQP